MSIAKTRLTDFAGALNERKLNELNYALGTALGLR